MGLAVRATGAAGLGAGTQRLVHDLPDGTGAASALRAASETAVDLRRRARQIPDHGIAHVMVSQDVAGTNDHEDSTLAGRDPLSIFKTRPRCKRKTAFLQRFQTAQGPAAR